MTVAIPRQVLEQLARYAKALLSSPVLPEHNAIMVRDMQAYIEKHLNEPTTDTPARPLKRAE